MGSIPIGLSSRGASLQVSTDGGVTWIAVAQLRNISPSGKKSDIVDQTNLLTPGSAKVKLATSVDPGAVAYDGVLNPNDVGLNLLSALQDGLTPALFRIVLPVPAVPIGVNPILASRTAPTGAIDILTEAGAALEMETGAPVLAESSGVPSVDCHLQFAAAALPPWLVPGIYVAVNISDSSFNGQFLVTATDGPSVVGDQTVCGFSYVQAAGAVVSDEAVTGGAQQAWIPTTLTFAGYVKEHLVPKLAIGKLCTFSGALEISGPISVVLGSPWGAPATTGEGEEPLNWLTYTANANIPPAAVVAAKVNAGSGTVTLTLTGQEGELFYLIDQAGTVVLTDSGGALFGVDDSFELTGAGQTAVLAYTGGLWWVMAQGS